LEWNTGFAEEYHGKRTLAPKGAGTKREDLNWSLGEAQQPEEANLRGVGNRSRGDRAPRETKTFDRASMGMAQPEAIAFVAEQPEQQSRRERAAQSFTRDNFEQKQPTLTFSANEVSRNVFGSVQLRPMPGRETRSLQDSR